MPGRQPAIPKTVR